MSASVTRPDQVNVLWFLPTHGDGRYLGTTIGGRATDLTYLRQIAEAADRLGYFGVLLPTGKSCEDSWIVASALLTSTRATPLPGRGEAGPAAAHGCCAHDGDARPPHQWAPVDQRCHRR